MKKNIAIIFLILVLTACSNANNNNINISEAPEEIQEPSLKPIETEVDIPITDTKQSKLGQIINSEYVITEPVIVQAERFKEMEYLFLAKELAGQYTDSGDYWHEYALLGRACDTYEKGKTYYDKINSIYRKSQKISNYEELKERYGKGYMQHFYERNITAFSVDGERVLLKTLIAPFSSDKATYEVYMGDRFLRVFLFKDAVNAGLYNYTTDIQYISIDEGDVPGFDDIETFYKIKAGVNVIEEEKTYSLTRTTDITDTVCYKCDVDIDSTVYLCLYSIDNGELVYKSEPVRTLPDEPDTQIVPGYVAIQNNKLIVGYSSKALKPENQSFYMDYYDYFEIDMETNEVNYLCTNGEGSFSPDGKYLAYAPRHYKDPMVQQGYYIYCVETGETAFISTGIIGNIFGTDYKNEIICWAHKDGLASLTEIAWLP